MPGAYALTTRPVVELKVGAYAQHKTQHRICELNQDAFIFQRLNLGGIGFAEHLDSGIWACSSKINSGKLDAAVSKLWKAMFKVSHPQEFATNPPDLNKWHKAFKFVVDNVAEEGNKLFPAARHLAVNTGMTYPEVGEIDNTFITGLAVPGDRMDYDSAAVESTVRYKNPPANLDEQSLLILSTQHDPQLIANFSGFKVRARAKERHSVVLICTEDGLRGLLEDAACTPPLDRHHWQDSPNQPCEFAVDTVAECPTP